MKMQCLLHVNVFHVSIPGHNEEFSHHPTSFSNELLNQFGSRYSKIIRNNYYQVNIVKGNARVCGGGGAGLASLEIPSWIEELVDEPGNSCLDRWKGGRVSESENFRFDKGKRGAGLASLEIPRLDRVKNVIQLLMQSFFFKIKKIMAGQIFTLLYYTLTNSS